MRQEPGRDETETATLFGVICLLGLVHFLKSGSWVGLAMVSMFSIGILGMLLPFEWTAHPERYPDHVVRQWTRYTLRICLSSVVLYMVLVAVLLAT